METFSLSRPIFTSTRPPSGVFSTAFFKSPIKHVFEDHRIHEDGRIPITGQDKLNVAMRGITRCVGNGLFDDRIDNEDAFRPAVGRYVIRRRNLSGIARVPCI